VCIKHYSLLLYAIATLSPYSQETEVLENQEVREAGEENKRARFPVRNVSAV
jgi:hypothetical protein